MGFGLQFPDPRRETILNQCDQLAESPSDQQDQRDERKRSTRS
jgi:hypothetical protein